MILVVLPLVWMVEVLSRKDIHSVGKVGDPVFM